LELCEPQLNAIVAGGLTKHNETARLARLSKRSRGIRGVMAEDKQSPSEENAKLALSLARHTVAASAAARPLELADVNGVETHQLNLI